MALIRCKECDKEISDKVKQCIHCGVKVKKTIPIAIKILLVILTILAILYGVWAFHVYKEETRQEEQERQQYLEKQKIYEKMEQEFLDLIRDIIYDFKDPQSVSIMWAYKVNGVWVCEIRATNSYGGYVTERYVEYEGKLLYYQEVNKKNKNFINNLNEHRKITGADYEFDYLDNINSQICYWFNACNK